MSSRSKEYTKNRARARQHIGRSKSQTGSAKTKYGKRHRKAKRMAAVTAAAVSSLLAMYVFKAAFGDHSPVEHPSFTPKEHASIRRKARSLLSQADKLDGDSGISFTRKEQEDIRRRAKALLEVF